MKNETKLNEVSGDVSTFCRCAAIAMLAIDNGNEIDKSFTYFDENPLSDLAKTLSAALANQVFEEDACLYLHCSPYVYAGRETSSGMKFIVFKEDENKIIYSCVFNN